jgi:hypothetical protein
MAEAKESAEDGRSGREEGDPERECTESDSDEPDVTADIRTMVLHAERGSVLEEDPFLLLGRLLPSGVKTTEAELAGDPKLIYITNQCYS